MRRVAPELQLRREDILSISLHHVKWVISKAHLPVIFVMLLSSAFLSPFTNTQVVNAQPSLSVEFFNAGTDLSELLQGHPGRGYLIYYWNERDEKQPRFLIELDNSHNAEKIVANVYQPLDSSDHLLIDWDSQTKSLLHGGVLILRMEAIDGWWVKNGKTNYNIDVHVFGQIVAMWGAEQWAHRLQPTEANAYIVIRDTNGDGLPDWDWRTMLPEFPGQAHLRTNYSESKCVSPVNVEPGVFPEWPYVSMDNNFEQESGSFRPPVVISPETGRIEYFSELVTVRNQNCSYSLYSISPVTPGELNHPNFETPFAFYDLSGEGLGYPNLIIRTERIAKNDEYLFLNNNPEIHSIRYSWRNQIGDRRWDYKVEVLGQHQYSAKTPIAGGAALIDAPSYEEFPSWVIKRDWPSTVFIGTEGEHYSSSEGIYEWIPLGLSNKFYFGWAKEPDLRRFNDIAIGLRGEYRINVTHPPELYLSALDNRLHLKWAEHGLWRVSDEEVIRLTNLDRNESIDVWSRELMPKIMTADTEMRSGEGVTIDDDNYSSSYVIESLYALDDFLLHDGESGITLISTDYDPILFETLPPTNHETWKLHRAQLAPYEETRPDPTSLHAWLDAFSGTRVEIESAHVANVRFIDDGFRFELSLEPGYEILGPDLLALSNIGLGDYLVENRNGSFTVTPLLPANLDIDANLSLDNSNVATVQLSIHNTGAADTSDIRLIAEITLPDGTSSELTQTFIDILGMGTQQLLIDVPVTSGGTTMHIRLENSKGQVVAVAEPLVIEGQGEYKSAAYTLWQMPAAALPLVFFALIIAVTTLLTIRRRPRQITP